MDDNAQMLVSITEMVNSNLESIGRLGEQAKKYQEMLQDILDNDPGFQEQAKQAKQANQAKSQAKKQILKQPQAADLAGKVKDLRTEIKELRNGLSDYLQEYQRLSGAKEFEDKEGNMLQIVYVAKLVKAK